MAKNDKDTNSAGGCCALYFIGVLLLFIIFGLSLTQCQHENDTHAQYDAIQCDISLVNDDEYPCCAMTQAQCNTVGGLYPVCNHTKISEHGIRCQSMDRCCAATVRECDRNRRCKTVCSQYGINSYVKDCDGLVCNDFLVLLVAYGAEHKDLANVVGVPCRHNEPCKDNIRELLTQQRVDCYVREGVITLTRPGKCSAGRLAWGIVAIIAATALVIVPTVYLWRTK